MSRPARRPVNRSARKPAKVKKEEPENSNSLNPSPDVVRRVARCLLPITPEEVMFREAGEAPIFGAINSMAIMGSLGFVGGSVGYFMTEKPPFSVSAMCKSGLKSGLQFGLEAGISDFIAASLGQWRGEEKVYDRVIAGAVAGGVMSIPHGSKAVLVGATKGAAMSAGMALLQAAQRSI